MNECEADKARDLKENRAFQRERNIHLPEIQEEDGHGPVVQSGENGDSQKRVRFT